MPTNFLFNSNRIIPAPFVSIREERQKSEDGTTRRIGFVIEVKGRLMAQMGSPTGAGAFYNLSGYPPGDPQTVADTSMLATLRTKQAALSSLLTAEGALLEIQPADGTPSWKANCRVREGPDYPEGNWYNECPYTIVLECDSLTIGGTTLGSLTTSQADAPPEESWQLEPTDEYRISYRLTHSVSAQARRAYDTNGNVIAEGWQVAQDKVLGLGLTGTQNYLGLVPAMGVASGVANLTGWGAYNYARVQHVDEAAGRFSVTETWLMFNANGGPPAIEIYNANVRYALETNRATVNVEGTITGLEQDNGNAAVTTSRISNAQSAWSTIQSALLGRAQAAAGTTLHPTPLNQTSSQNPLHGIITYNYEFDNRSTFLVPGAVSESITVEDNLPVDLFARLTVLGRALGPIYQDLNTISEATRSVSIEAVLPGQTYGVAASSQPNTNSIVVSYLPTGYTVIRTTSDRTNWTPRTGRYSRQVVYSCTN